MTKELQGTLRDRFMIHKACEGLPVSHIKLAVKPGEKRTPVNKMLKSLTLAGYERIGDILDIQYSKVGIINGLERSECNLLFGLLRRISNNPSLIINLEILRLLEEEYITKEERKGKIEVIKHRLREMGMIE
ncbi:hypothetical protein JI735_28965 [Paenibacillus sonchi]|uniref:Uncharacterized protein n=1 Tax=Paenibacillus sonchi TaxID=373687 RepID=A0A974PAK1_9BACL|nr:hypothetical protein [Paenibacillus sonchi]QQZ60482.1 hypothetical protein JI735_28965 [Paenibacillus sonchi]